MRIKIKNMTQRKGGNVKRSESEVKDQGHMLQTFEMLASNLVKYEEAIIYAFYQFQKENKKKK